MYPCEEEGATIRYLGSLSDTAGAFQGKYVPATYFDVELEPSRMVFPKRSTTRSLPTFSVVKPSFVLTGRNGLTTSRLFCLTAVTHFGLRQETKDYALSSL